MCIHLYSLYVYNIYTIIYQSLSICILTPSYTKRAVKDFKATARSLPSSRGIAHSWSSSRRKSKAQFSEFPQRRAALNDILLSFLGFMVTYMDTCGAYVHGNMMVMGIFMGRSLGISSSIFWSQPRGTANYLRFVHAA